MTIREIREIANLIRNGCNRTGEPNRTAISKHIRHLADATLEQLTGCKVVACTDPRQIDDVNGALLILELDEVRMAMMRTGGVREIKRLNLELERFSISEPWNKRVTEASWHSASRHRSYTSSLQSRQ